MDMKLYKVLKAPHITEQSSQLNQDLKQIVFLKRDNKSSAWASWFCFLNRHLSSLPRIEYQNQDSKTQRPFCNQIFYKLQIYFF